MDKTLCELSYRMPIFKGNAVNHESARHNIIKEIQTTPKYSIRSEDIQLTDCDWHLRESYPKTYWPYAFDAISPCITQSAVEMEFSRWEIGDHWYQWYEQGDYHNWHTHGNSMFVGVYYALLPSGSPSITFNWQGELITFDVEEGDVIIFPAYLRHKASVNESSETKVILSFNLNYR